MVRFTHNFIKIFNISTLLLLFLGFYSCSTVKESDKEDSKLPKIIVDTVEIINFKKNLDGFTCNGVLKFSDLKQNMEGTFELRIIRGNTAMLDIFGPFGINVARIYANNDSISVYNLWSKKVFVTSASIKGFEYLSPFTVKLFKFFIAEPLEDKDSVSKERFRSDTLMFVNKLSDSVWNKYYFSLKHSSMTYLTSKSKDIDFESYFRNLKQRDGYFIPEKLELYDLRNKAQLKIEVEEFKEMKVVNKIIDELKNSKFKKVYTLEELF